ncbi:Helix-turn-helix domain-containing protein [Shimia gijangensis]|uniref:Helix-turn-helix domain-containing protein n=1 Tax=Shimia gijangensis TaxID=1470563 RepID=A0A1M6D8X4_9RHOB|nr:Helix-turn-helix domain-containing protein [Shimia gijangensis]
MAYRKRTIFSEKQKMEIWDRWQRGESMGSIGRVFDRGSPPIYPLLERTGGIRPIARTRSRMALTLVERKEISRGLVAKQPLRSIARNLHRNPSTISREVRRNGGTKHYRAAKPEA